MGNNQEINMEKDTSVVPKGDYCYDFDGERQVNCPYWSIRSDMPKQMNGYCSLLERGDWEFDRKNHKVTAIENGKERVLSEEEKEELDDHFFAGILWDQVKECEINRDDD